jgi:hypothetical protein
MDLDHAPVGQLDCERFEWGPRLEMANLIRHISSLTRLVFLYYRNTSRTTSTISQGGMVQTSR